MGMHVCNSKKTAEDISQYIQMVFFWLALITFSTFTEKRLLDILRLIRASYVDVQFYLGMLARMIWFDL